MKAHDEELAGELAEPAGGQRRELGSPAPGITLQDLHDHLPGPVISVVCHFLILAFISTMILIRPPPEEEKETLPVDYLQPPETVEIKKVPVPPDFQQEDRDPRMIQRETPQPVKDEPIEIKPVPLDLPMAEVMVPMVGLEFNPRPPTNAPPAVGNRITAQAQQEAFNRFHAPKQTRSTMWKALRWLKDHQNPDGSWGDGNPQHQSALTGLALLTFLACGQTPVSVEFGPCVLGAIKKCCEYIERGGGEIKEGSGYAHGIVTYALAEAYTLTHIPRLVEPVERAVAVIVRGQNQFGGFNYSYKTAPEADGRPRTDMSVTGWQCQALKAAFAAGCAAPGIERAIEQCVRAIQNEVCIPGQGFSYDNRRSGASDTMTAAGTLCLQLLGAGRSKAAKDGLAALESRHFKFDWEQPGAWFLYRNYYQTQAQFQGTEGRGAKWDAWNKLFSYAVIHEQFDDGHWEVPGGREKEIFKGIDMPVYATTMCCLMLTVYIRYLPTYEVVDTKDASPVKSPEDGLEIKLETN